MIAIINMMFPLRSAAPVLTEENLQNIMSLQSTIFGKQITRMMDLAKSGMKRSKRESEKTGPGDERETKDRNMPRARQGPPL